MDPSLSDPNIVIIHPPFVTFPNAHLYPEGLSYSLMAANPDWFLDQNDFVNGSSTSPDAIPYPPQLEPPRGWCPAKKKDLKALGPDGWPEGEEPRLRCTFCRRTYAGVNAKSMWRRHVYEKHKIAMSNRREGHDRTRGGRGSGRERNNHHDKENYTDDRRASRGPDNKSRKSRNLSLRNSITPTPDPEDNDDDDDADDDDDDPPVPSAPVIKQNEFPALSSPPVLKHAKLLDEGVTLTDSYNLRGGQADDSSASPKTSRFAVPMSPYDPTLTPSFRHSPPRLPSDQPWRFPSPSHPLHSGAREFCLSMLARATPVTKGSSVNDSSSPSTGTTSVMNTPCSTTFRGKTFGDLGSIFSEGSSPIIFRPSPRHLISDNRSPVPVFTRLDFRKRLNDSSLGGGLRRKLGHDRKKTAMNNSFDLQGGWLSDNSLSSSVSSLSNPAILSPARLTSDDPFGSPFKPLESTLRHPPEKRVILPPLSSPEVESPVMRHFRLPDNETSESNDGLVGLGIGLMAPFDLSTSHREAEEKDEAEVEGVLIDDLAPPLKKRRVTFG
ncbi:uncharacterized protein EDB93DRAFT_1074637 [Suillus bovinus]|uniref:uncharacterized protein n=1 Tax=Suillus bovinus TaxID=48563 RepID=UPI001B885C13|nr:uncharacterized protein EDB93DRAFT_1074637 [Suillus bovinus]KAG2159966.1 hypothetical protein EDB93DRAFT_1074637 [Suillus bovinus]